MRRFALVLIAMLAFTACGSGDDVAAFCDSITALNTFDRENSTVDTVTGLVEELVASAPDAISEDATAFGEGMTALTEGDFESASDPSFTGAARRLEAFASENCTEK